MDSATPRCATHERRRALALCNGCGRPLCRHCRRQRGPLSWCKECAPPIDTSRLRRGSPADDGTAADLPERGPAPVPVAALAARLPRVIYAILALQLVATVFAGWVAWSVGEPATAASTSPEIGAPAPRTTLRAPLLTLRDGTLLRGAPILLRGTAPDGEFVVLLVDGAVTATALVEETVFEFAAIVRRSSGAATGDTDTDTGAEAGDARDAGGGASGGGDSVALTGRDVELAVAAARQGWSSPSSPLRVLCGPARKLSTSR